MRIEVFHTSVHHEMELHPNQVPDSPAQAQLGVDAERACEQLCTDFANALDAQEYDRVLQLFAPDGVVLSGEHAVFGHAAINESLIARSSDMVTRHVCSNIRITPQSSDSATGICYVVCYKFRGETGGRGPLKTPAPIVGEYRDRYVRTAAGWRIHERRIVVVFDPLDASE